LLRDGRIIGRKEYVLEDTDALTQGVVAQVLQRVYAEEPPPARILVETEPEGLAVLREWLGGLRGTLPKIFVPKRGEKVELLQMAQENARLALERKFEPEELNKAVLQGLQAFLDLPHLPVKIECFDISHAGGREVVASCVTFAGGLPDKDGYRRFKLSNEQNDDFANMAEVLSRRYRRLVEEGRELPNLVIVDGGLGQLHAAEAVLKVLGVDLELASLAKKEELVYRPAAAEPLRIPKSSPVLQLLQRVRDEAHRFAVSYHRALRAKRVIQTELTNIQGIGQATAKKLLKEFGSAAKVREAAEPDLARAVGKSVASKIVAWRARD
jgi:excinuclease ABC subunit C